MGGPGANGLNCLVLENWSTSIECQLLNCWQSSLHNILQPRLQIYNENVDDLLSTKVIKDHS